MPLVRMSSVLLDAQKNKYAVPAFNVCNLEYLKTVILTAEKLSAPVIIAIHPVEIAYGGIEELATLTKIMAKNVSIPVVLHLDHGDTITDVATAIRHGFTSVMIDASKKSLEENIQITSEIVRFSHATGVCVEAELGIVGGTEGDDTASVVNPEQMTKPLIAKEFVDATKIDSLAVAIGTAHGVYVKEPHIDIERLKEIREATTVPLVLHGGSGISDTVIKKAIENGITKINIATELKQAFQEGVNKFIAENPGEFEPRRIYPEGMKTASQLVERKIRLFNAQNKA